MIIMMNILRIVVREGLLKSVKQEWACGKYLEHCIEG
jgi:hypothetical protein